MHREPLRDDAYWQKWIEECKYEIDDISKMLSTNPFPEKWRKDTATRNLYDEYRNYIKLEYSGGVPIEEIEKNYAPLIDAWVAYNQNISTGDNKKHLLLTNDYYRVLTLISWGIIFDAPVELFQKIANHIHSNGEDALIETLLSSQMKDRTATDKLIYPKSFELLYKATQTKGAEQAAFVKDYLGNWYKNMKDFINYDAHKSKGEGGFDGYWSFETAAVVILYDMDDSSFRDMDFYPKDMVAFAKTKA